LTLDQLIVAFGARCWWGSVLSGVLRSPFPHTAGAETTGGAAQKPAKGCLSRLNSCFVVVKVELDAISLLPTLILGSCRIEISPAGPSGFAGSILHRDSDPAIWSGLKKHV